MLTGQPPFKGENEFVLRDAKLSEDPVPPSRLSREIPGELDKLILRAIDKDPARRFASVAEMKSELLKLSGKPAGPAKTDAAKSSPASSAGSPARHGKGGKIVGAVAGLVIIVTAAIFGIKMMSGGGEGGITTPAKDTAGTLRPSLVDAQRVVENAAPAPGGALEPRGNESAADTLAAKAVEKKKPAAAIGTIAATTGAKSSKPAPAVPGFLKVLSRPKGAAIYINGELQYEKTPFTFDRPPGQYTVRIVRIIGGKELSHTRTVTLESDETEIISHTFEE
jgi:hypothetical protein